MKRRSITAIAAICFSLFVFFRPVYAYIDPATTTYVIQIVSALIITLGVTIGMFFTRMRLSIINLYVRASGFAVRLFSKKKGDTGDAHTKVPVKRPAKIERLDLDSSLKRKSRLTLSLLLGGAIAFTFVLFGIIELYLLNKESFVYPLSQILPLTLILFFAVFILLVGILILIPRRFFHGFTAFLFGILLAGYSQANFMNRSLGQLTGDKIAWEERGADFVWNTLFWLAIVAGSVFLMRKNRRLAHKLIKAVSILLIVIQLISLFTLYEPSAEKKQEELILTTKGIHEIAAKENIIVIVLDRLDNRYIESVLADDPAFFAPLDGFTRFTDNVSLYSQTFPAVANMFSGKIHLFERTNRAYLKDAWSNSTFMPGLKADDFTVHLYMEEGYTYADPEDLAAFTDNVIKGEIRVKPLESAEQFMRLAAFRYAPLAAKPFLWTTTERFSQLVSTEAEVPPYVTDDVRYYDSLKEEKLSIAERDKQFTYIHLRGSHAPYVMNEKAQTVPSDQSNSTIQTKGSFHIVYEYLAQLRALGHYDDSTIVITGDHGSRKTDRKPLDEAIVTALFVKRAGEAGTPLKENDAPVSSDHLRRFIYKEASLATEGMEPSYFEAPREATTPRYLYHRLLASDDLPSRLLIYEINGDANDFANWTLKEERELFY